MKAKALLFLVLAVLSLACVGACSPASEDGNQADPSAFDSLDSDGDDQEAVAGARVSRYPDFVPQAWFPLEEGARYTFRGTFKGETETTTLTVVRHETPFGYLYFFAGDEKIDEPDPLLSANMFGLAGYLTTATEVLTVQATYLEGFQAERSAYVQTLLRVPPKVGDSLELREEGVTYRLEVSGREDVVVPAGRFEGCLKLKIDRFGESSFVWIAENVGMVRWKRATGRVDELVRYEAHPESPVPPPRGRPVAAGAVLNQ